MAQGRIAPPRRGADRRVRQVLLPAGLRRRRERQRAADGAPAPARRLRAEGAALAPARHGLPVRGRAAAHRPGAPRRLVHRARPRRHGAARAGRPGSRRQQGRPRRGRRPHPQPALPRGHDAGRAARRPDPLARRARRGRVRPGRARRSTSPRSSARPWSGSRSRRARGSSMDNGTENMDWVARALRRIVEFTQARRRDQHHRHGDQRRRPAVLERRGDDADAHQGHPRHDPRQRDGADRQAVAGLLRRRLRRGQLRHRRLRPGDGSERAGAVLGARPRRRRRGPASRTTTTPTSRPGERSPRRAPTSDPRDRDVRDYPHEHPDSDFRTVGDIFSAARTPSARRRSTSAR